MADRYLLNLLQSTIICFQQPRPNLGCINHIQCTSTNAIRQVIFNLNSDGIDPLKIVRVCNAASGWPVKTLSYVNVVKSLEMRGDTTWEESVLA